MTFEYGRLKKGRQTINCMHSEGLLNTETFQNPMYFVNGFDYFRKFAMPNFLVKFCKF